MQAMQQWGGEEGRPHQSEEKESRRWLWLVEEMEDSGAKEKPRYLSPDTLF